MSSTTPFSRNGKRWSVNECLKLQREFELLNMTIDEIATAHQRSPNAIMFKLDQEGFADYNTLYATYHFVPPPCVPTTTSIYYDEDVTESDFEHLVKGGEFSDDDSASPTNLRQQMVRLEQQIKLLTDMLIHQTRATSKKSSVLSLFS